MISRPFKANLPNHQLGLLDHACSVCKQSSGSELITCYGGGLKHLFIFTPTWGDDPIWRIFFQMGWNHQLVLGYIFWIWINLVIWPTIWLKTPLPSRGQQTWHFHLLPTSSLSTASLRWAEILGVQCWNILCKWGNPHPQTRTIKGFYMFL